MGGHKAAFMREIAFDIIDSLLISQGNNAVAKSDF